VGTEQASNSNVPTQWVRRGLAVFELALGSYILHWCFTRGYLDQSTLGTMAFTCGAIGGFFVLLVPGVVLLVRPSRWGCLQLFTAVVSALFVAWFLVGLVIKWAS
jgi:hypothetical protein